MHHYQTKSISTAEKKIDEVQPIQNIEENNMELKHFVSETLKQVIEGVKTAQSSVKELGGEINPKGIYSTSTTSHPQLYAHDGIFVQLMDFDVAITTVEEDKAKGGIGIFVGAFGVGAHGESGSQNSAINRIQFKVPIVLPNQD